FCCTGPEDCARHGVDEPMRACADGLACVENACVVPTCAGTGCGAAAPVCEITTDTCVGCTISNDCARFPQTSVCETASGSCVECVSDLDCSGEEPVCESGTCRGCVLDTECPSGACAD